MRCFPKVERRDIFAGGVMRIGDPSTLISRRSKYKIKGNHS